jgi:hypothetical protein
MNTFERAQEVTDVGPHAISNVAVDFANTIAVIIAGPFTRANFVGTSKGFSHSRKNKIISPIK